jgi:hypothetical protein
MKMADSTEARDIALHFIAKMRVQPVKVEWEIARVTARAKQLLQQYTKVQILSVIDYAFQKNSSIYSFGYVVSLMEDVLALLQSEKDKDVAKVTVAEQVASLEKERKEVEFDEQSAERNRSKASRFGVQSRIGEKYSFDLLKGQ